MKRVLTLFAFLSLCHGVAYCKIWSPDIFPNPKRDTHLCGRSGKKSSICDPDSVLSVKAANRIDGIIQDIQGGESPYKKDVCGAQGMQGYQVAVAVMKKMRVDQGMNPKDVARNFAKELHARWGVGLAECDNGVLLLLSVQDRQIYISTGVQSAQVLPLNDLNVIIEWMIPYLRKQEYDEGVIRAVTNIGLALSKWEISNDDESWSAGLFFFLIVLAFIVFSLITGGISSRKRQKRLETCKDVLRKIKEEQDCVQNKEWSQHKTCPVCFEEFDDDVEEECMEEDGEASRLLHNKNETRDKTESSKRNRLKLQCGHSICESCLEEWMKTSRSCPVCRQEVVDDKGDEGEPSQTRSGQNPARVRNVLAGDILAADLVYRLQRAQRMYPEYISDELIDEWRTDSTQTGTFDFQKFSDHQVRNQAIAAAQEHRGFAGNATSFGGGSGGGGGAGASW